MIEEKTKNKKAFTILELMAVLIIIGILATLVIASVTSYKKRASEEYIESLENQIILAAKDYYSNNPTELPRGQIVNNEKIYSTSIMASKLAQDNYLTNELVDENDNSCEKSYAIVDNIFGNYNYKPCLICDGKVLSVDENGDALGYCKVKGPEVVNKSPYCSIRVENTDRAYTKKLSVYTNATIIKAPVEVAKDGNYYVVKPELYKFTVEKDGKTADCSMSVYMEPDTIPPFCSISCACEAEKGVSDSNCSCITTWSDNGILKSVKDSIGHLDYTYPLTYETNVSPDGNNESPAIIKKSKIKDYSVTVTDLENNEFTCTGNDTDAKVDCNCEIRDYSSCLICSCNKDTCTISCRDNPACSRPSKDDDNDPSPGITDILPDDDPKPSTPTNPTPSTPTEPDEEEEEDNPYTGIGDDDIDWGEAFNGCFLAGTKVLTNNGYKNIEEIVVGDYVLSYNEDTKATEYNKVYIKLVHPNNSEELYELTIKGEILKVTEAHRFYAKEKGNSDFDWKKVSELKVGDIVLDSNNKEHKITNINHYKHFGTVYNFGVENNSNYYVSENEILVHNAAGRGPNSSNLLK